MIGKLQPEQGRYGKHQFTIKCTDVTDVNTKDRGKWDESSGIVKEFSPLLKKLKIDTLYEVQALGSMQVRRHNKVFLIKIWDMHLKVLELL